jgi:hypothetical protein
LDVAVDGKNGFFPLVDSGTQLLDTHVNRQNVDMAVLLVEDGCGCCDCGMFIFRFVIVVVVVAEPLFE